MKLLTPTATNTMIIAAATKQILRKVGGGIWSVVTFPFTAVNKFVIKPLLNGVWSLVKLPFKLIGGLLGKVWSGLKGCFMFSISNIWKFIKTPAGLALLAYGAGYVYGRWIKPLWDRHLAPFLYDKLIPFWNNTVKPFWNGVLVPFVEWGWNFLKTNVPKFIDWINETAKPFYDEKIKPAIEKVYKFFESIGKFMGVENPFLAALTGFFATDMFVTKIVPIVAKVLLNSPGLAFSIGKALLAPLGLVGLGAYLSSKTHASIGTSTSFVAAGVT